MRTIHHAMIEAIRDSRVMPRAILDVGCGNGSFTQALSTAFPRAAITAIDTSIQKPFRLGNVSFIKGNAEDLPFDPGSFDLVIAALSLHHWEEKGRGVSEAYRVLKKNGRLMIGDPLLEDWMRNRILGWLMQVTDGGTFTDAKGIRGHLNAAGFEDIHIRLVPGTMRSLYLITAKKG